MSAKLIVARAVRAAGVSSRRALSSAAETKGPALPPGNDPSAYHSRAHAVADTSRWALISAVCFLPVTGFGFIALGHEHVHGDAPIQYDYMKRASRVPRFPWVCFEREGEMEKWR